MEFTVLGTLDVQCRERPIRLTRPKSRALLALLLARVNRSVTAEQLIDELWHGDPPASAETAFRVHLTHLRSAIGPWPDGRSGPIHSAANGYRIGLDEATLDALHFEAVLDRAREAARSGAPREAADLLAEDLKTFRGPAFAGVLDLEAVRAEAVRLDGLRLTALELLADAEITLDRADEACELLGPVVAEHPLRESLTEKLMLALYRSGRQSDALRAFSRLREALDRELGVPPSPTVRALEHAIVVQGPELDAPAAAPRRTSIFVRDVMPFVGRRAESAALDRAWDETCGGAVRLVFLAGPSGIGKTTLAEYSARRAAEGGGRVFVGNCEPDPVSNYEPFPQLVRKILETVRREQIAPSVLGELGHLSADLADQATAPAASADAAAGRHRLFVAVSELLAATHPSPTLLVVDDLHWAGRDALALLRHVVREARGPLMVIGTYRDDEAGPGTVLGDALSEGRLAEADVAITLDGLDTAALLALVRAKAPDDVRTRLSPHLAKLQELTGGNPLFVREVLREVALSSGEVELDDLVPGGVRALVERRLVRLSPTTRSALAVGAVLGREFSLRLLAETAALSQSEALNALEESIGGGFLEEGDRVDLFVFCHPLVRNAIYAATAASRRARLHLRAGTALAAELAGHGEGRWAEPARHFLAALPVGDEETAADYAVRAGDDAAAKFAHSDAATWYRRALDLARDAGWTTGREASTLLALGESLEKAGRRDAARPVYVEAAAKAKLAGDHALLADVAIAATPRYITVDEFHPTQVALVDDALTTIGDDERRRAWLLSCAGASRYYDSPADERYATEALALARESDDPEVRVAGLISHHRWLTHDPGTMEQRLSVSRELQALCRQHHLDALAGRVTRTLLVDLLELGHTSEFDGELAAFATTSARNGVPADLYWASALRATRTLMRTSGEDAEAFVSAAKTLGQRLQQGDAEGVYFLQSFALRYQQDRTREITPPLTLPADAHPRTIPGLALLGAALVEGGRARGVRSVLDRIIVDGELRVPSDNLWLASVALAGAMTALVGTAAERTLITEALAPFADRWCVFGAGGAVFGTGHHWLARLAVADGDVDSAQMHLVRARDLSEDAGATYWAQVAQQRLFAITQPSDP